MAGRGAYVKKALNIVSVRARHSLLIDGIRSPASLARAVHGALVGQRAFAALDVPKLKITPLALNTIKSLADELFTEPDEDGRTGFLHLNSLRVRLVQMLSEAAGTRTVSVKADRAADKTANLMSRLAATEAQSVKRQKAYLSLYAAVNGLIKSGNLQADAQERLYRVLENHHSTFAELFEPEIGMSTGIKAKVTSLRKKDKSK